MNDVTQIFACIGLLTVVLIFLALVAMIGDWADRKWK